MPMVVAPSAGRIPPRPRSFNRFFPGEMKGLHGVRTGYSSQEMQVALLSC